jgi:hypothetical protein
MANRPRRSLIYSLVTLGSLSLSLFPVPISAEVVSASSSSSSSTQPNASKHRYESHATTGDLVCRPFGECEPCPQDEVSLSRGHLDVLAHVEIFKLTVSSCFPPCILDLTAPSSLLSSIREPPTRALYPAFTPRLQPFTSRSQFRFDR